jgi:hypothetical protein
MIGNMENMKVCAQPPVSAIPCALSQVCFHAPFSCVRYCRRVPPATSADCAPPSSSANTTAHSSNRRAQACLGTLWPPDAQQEPIRVCHAKWVPHPANHTRRRAIYVRPCCQVPTCFPVSHHTHLGSSGTTTPRPILP